MIEDSTAAYATNAAELLKRYESGPFERAHETVLQLLPAAPARVLDVGAGSGRDAAYFAERGDHILAVEPTREMREGAVALHPSPRIEWLDDRLPHLNAVVSRGEQFDLIWLSAVFMHFDEAERATALCVLARLLRAGGGLMMTLRHGPIPEGRRIFEVTADDVIPIAQALGLRCAHNGHEASRGGPNAVAGVTWTRLWFVKD